MFVCSACPTGTGHRPAACARLSPACLCSTQRPPAPPVSASLVLVLTSQPLVSVCVCLCATQTVWPPPHATAPLCPASPVLPPARVSAAAPPQAPSKNPRTPSNKTHAPLSLRLSC